MSIDMTVRQLRDAFDELVARGYADLPVQMGHYAKGDTGIELRTVGIDLVSFADPEKCSIIMYPK